jgi:hypothetical protein
MGEARIDPDAGFFMRSRSEPFNVKKTEHTVIEAYWIGPDNKIKCEQITVPEGKYELDAIHKTYWRETDLHYTQLSLRMMTLVEMCIKVIKGQEGMKLEKLPLDLIEKLM